MDNRGEGGRVVVVVCKREGLIGDVGKIHYCVYKILIFLFIVIINKNDHNFAANDIVSMQWV